MTKPYIPTPDEVEKHAKLMFGKEVTLNRDADFDGGIGFELQYPDGPLGWFFYDPNAANYEWTVGRFEHDPGDRETPPDWTDIEIGKQRGYWGALEMLAMELAELRIDRVIEGICENMMDEQLEEAERKLGL